MKLKIFKRLIFSDSPYFLFCRRMWLSLPVADVGSEAMDPSLLMVLTTKFFSRVKLVSPTLSELSITNTMSRAPQCFSQSEEGNQTGGGSVCRGISSVQMCLNDPPTTTTARFPDVRHDVTVLRAHAHRLDVKRRRLIVLFSSLLYIQWSQDRRPVLDPPARTQDKDWAVRFGVKSACTAVFTAQMLTSSPASPRGPRSPDSPGWPGSPWMQTIFHQKWLTAHRKTGCSRNDSFFSIMSSWKDTAIKLSQQKKVVLISFAADLQSHISRDKGNTSCRFWNIQLFLRVDDGSWVFMISAAVLIISIFLPDSCLNYLKQSCL